MGTLQRIFYKWLATIVYAVLFFPALIISIASLLEVDAIEGLSSLYYKIKYKNRDS
jgi:hypothetical protein